MKTTGEVAQFYYYCRTGNTNPSTYPPLDLQGREVVIEDNNSGADHQAER